MEIMEPVPASPARELGRILGLTFARIAGTLLLTGAACWLLLDRWAWGRSWAEPAVSGVLVAGAIVVAGLLFHAGKKTAGVIRIGRTHIEPSHRRAE